jgi:PAS domain S-box-containing protein
LNARDTSAILKASLLLDGEDRILEGNRDAEVFLEKPLEEVRKVPLYKANQPLYSALKELLTKTRRGRGVEDYAMAYKVGKRLMRLNINMSPYPLEALGTMGILVTISSVGMRPMPERRAPKKEAPVPVSGQAFGLQDLLGIMVEPAFILDLDANFTYANPAMCALLGHEQDELAGRPLSFFMRREDAKQALDRLVEAACSAPWRGELEFNRGDGTISFLAVTIEALREGNGKVTSLLGIGRDFTTEARIRREREDELMRVWSLLERVGLALVCFTPDFRVTLLSHSAEEALATTSDRAIGTTLHELFPAETRQEILSLLERAAGGEEIKEVLVEAGDAKERRAFFMSVRPAVEEGDRTREFMAILREATRQLSEMEETEALLRVLKRKEEILELALRNPELQDFLEKCLQGLQEEFGCAAAALFTVRRSEALLRAQLGLDEGEAKALSAMRLRPGHARLCGMLVRLKVEIHGGVPRRGWDEVHSFVEKADTLLPLLRERRWRNITVFPMRLEGGAIGAIAMADCDPVKADMAEDLVFTAAGEAVALALRALESRASEAPTAADVGAGESPASPLPAAGPVELQGMEAGVSPEEEASGVRETGLEKEAALEEGGRRGMIPTLGPMKEKEHDYFEIAMELKGEESPPESLALLAESSLGRSMPPPKGIDLPALLWDIKEYYGRGEKKGEIFLEIEDDLPKLHADKRLLRAALLQLIDNARKFSPPDSPVVLGAERWGDEVLLRVEDQGEGIAAEVVEEIMHWDLDEASHEVRGIAMSGLYRCRKYVAAMGGDLSIKGRPEEGTTAFLRLRVLPFIGGAT